MRRLLQVLVVVPVILVVIPLAAVSVSAGHVSCGATIMVDTTLDSDLLNCPGNGLIIGASGITLNLNGHTIDGSGGATGVLNSGHDNVVVTNGTIRDFFEGIKMESIVTNSFMTDLSIDAVWGILLLGGTGNTMSTNLITNTLSALAGDRIKLDNADSNLIRDNRTIDGTAKGIFLFSSSNNVVDHNQSTGNATEGIHLQDDSDNNLIVANSANFNLNGIVVDSLTSDGNDVLSNFAENNSNASIIIGGTTTTVQDNLARSFGALGIVVVGDGTAVNTNVARRNSDGIFVASGATATTIQNNHAVRNNDDGIDVDSADTSIGGNLANFNGDLGIEAVAGVTDLGGNSATGNGNPAQCTNVAC